MSIVYNQLSRKDDSPDGQSAGLRGAAGVQLELALPDLAPPEPLLPSLRARRARPPAVAPELSDIHARCELQTELTGSRTALALNKEIIKSLRRELAAAGEARQAAQDSLMSLQKDFEALKEQNLALAAERDKILQSPESPAEEPETPPDSNFREEEWAKERQGLEVRISEAEADAQKARRALADEQRLRQEELRQAASREKELNAQLMAARRSEAQAISDLSSRPGQLRIGAYAAAILVAGIVLAVFIKSCPRAETSVVPGPVAEVVPETVPPPAAAPAHAAAQGAALPAVEMKGLSAKPAGNGVLIVFDNGLFARRAVMSAEARGLLKELAEILRPAMPACRLEITGHADTEPSSDPDAPDNKTLGHQRAQAVAEYFVAECALPAGAISTDSAGDANAPYPNTTPELRRKNRTATLLLIAR